MNERAERLIFEGEILGGKCQTTLTEAIAAHTRYVETLQCGEDRDSIGDAEEVSPKEIP